MRAARTAAVLLGIAVAAPIAAPAPAHVGDGPPRAAAGAKKKKKKPKPVTCRAGQVRVTLGKRVTCRRLTAAAGQRAPQVALLLAVAQRNRTFRTRSGRRIPPLWNTGGGRLKAVRTRLARALPKAIALGRRARTSVRGDPTACADLASQPAQTGSFDGFTVSVTATGAVSMSVSAAGYRIEVIIDSNPTCSNLDLPACPDPDGALRGTDSHRGVLGLRVTKDGALVQSVRTTVRSTQTLRGTVADDAKLDTVNLEDVARESTTVALPGASVTVALSVLRTADLDMRSGAIRNASVRAGVGGFSAEDAGRTADEYARTFPALISEERENYKRRENLWQSPGTCAKLTFDPASDSLSPLADGAGGTVTGKVEANAGGVAAKAKWTVTAMGNGAFTPSTAQGGSAPFRYVVTRTGRNIRLSGTFKATSTAGVAEGTWAQKTQEPGPDAFYVVDAVNYDANHTSSSTESQNTICDVDASVHESLHLNTPRPFRPDFDKLTYSDGAYGGSISLDPADATATRTGTMHGCDISAPDPPPPACDTDVNVDVPVGIGVIVQVAAQSTDAKVTWILPAVAVGDGGPAVPCYTPTLVATPNPEERTVPASDILAPGSHTLTVTRPVNLNAPFGSIQGTTGASMTFHRVNADGSPYTG